MRGAAAWRSWSRRAWLKCCWAPCKMKPKLRSAFYKVIYIQLLFFWWNRSFNGMPVPYHRIGHLFFFFNGFCCHVYYWYCYCSCYCVSLLYLLLNDTDGSFGACYYSDLQFRWIWGIFRDLPRAVLHLCQWDTSGGSWANRDRKKDPSIRPG